MKAMILAAGVGSRLDPLTRNIPKPMVPILNKPVMTHIVELLVAHGFREIVMNVHHLPEQIMAHFGDGSAFGAAITYSREDELLGTAGGVKNVEDFFDDTFLVIGGDDLCDFDLTSFRKFHQAKGALATIGLSLVDDPSEYGAVVLDENSRIAQFVEKPKGEAVFTNTVNTGVYLFEPAVLNLIPQGKFFDFGRDLFPLLLKLKEPFHGFLTSSYWCDVGNLTQYRQAHYDALAGRVNIKFPMPKRQRFVWIGEDVEIHPDAVVEYPVAIGNGCRIGAGARVGEDSVIGDHCVIEPGAVVHHSIVWNNSVVAENTALHGCVVGSEVTVRANAAIFDGVIVSPNNHHGVSKP